MTEKHFVDDEKKMEDVISIKRQEAADHVHCIINLFQVIGNQPENL